MISKDDVLLLGDEEFEVVLSCNYGGKDIVLLHPTEMPKGVMFVCMEVDADDCMYQIDNEVIVNRIIKMYEAQEHIDTTKLALEYLANEEEEEDDYEDEELDEDDEDEDYMGDDDYE